MAAPQFVPLDPTHDPRDYASPPRREDEWWAVRPGDLGAEGQPSVDAGRMGAPGPDQGYLLKLVPMLRDELQLQPGEALADVEAGAVIVALKRAAILGRAPILKDLRVAYTVWGFLDPSPAPELVAVRRQMFEGVRHIAHHYPERRALADTVPEGTLRLDLAGVAAARRDHWAAVLRLPTASTH